MSIVKVVFCSLNSQYIHSSLAPWCLLAGVRAFGDPAIEAVVVEGTINEPMESILQRIKQQSPDAVGFCCYIWNIMQVKELAAQLKRELPTCFLFFGGPEVSYCSDVVLMENPCIEAVVCGEGERPVAELLKTIHRKESLKNVVGVSFRDGDFIVKSNPFTTEEEPPSPYAPEYFEALKGRIAYLETSRGCPFTCAFCLSGRCGGVRYYPMERVKQEVILLANSGTQTVKLVDRTFNANRKRALEIIRFILEHYGVDIPKSVCFHFEIAGDLLDEETLVTLSEAPKGLFQLEIGLQSFYEPTLEAVHRRTNMEKLTDNLKKLISAGTVHVHIDLIAGLPQETLALFAEGLNQAVALRPHMLQMGFLKLLHGADMREKTDEYPCQYAVKPPYEVLETPWISVDEMQLLHRVEDALDRMYNSGRFRRTLAYVMQAADKTAFEIFQHCSLHEQSARLSLDEYTEFLYAQLKELSGVNEDHLRDAMVCDWLSANPGGLLPICLQYRREKVKYFKKMADSDSRFARPHGVRRGAACLSGGNVMVYADQANRDPVTKTYPLRYFEEACLTRPYQAILFDLDGTLTDPAQGITNSVAYSLEKFGISVKDRRELYRFIGPPLIDSYRDFYGMTADQSRQALAYYREYYATKGIYENRVYEGIPKLLHDLQRHGYRLLVATSKPETYARRILDEFELTSYFEVIAGSDMGEKRADKARVIEYALQQASLNAEEKAIMVGDRSFDVIGAKKHGLPCVGVLFGYGDRPELETAGAAHIAQTVDDLRKLFLN